MATNQPHADKQRSCTVRAQTIALSPLRPPPRPTHPPQQGVVHFYRSGACNAKRKAAGSRHSGGAERGAPGVAAWHSGRGCFHSGNDFAAKPPIHATHARTGAVRPQRTVPHRKQSDARGQRGENSPCLHLFAAIGRRAFPKPSKSMRLERIGRCASPARPRIGLASVRTGANRRTA